MGLLESLPPPCRALVISLHAVLSERCKLQTGVLCCFLGKFLGETPDTGADMGTFLNVGRMDRALRMVLGIGLGIAGILVNGHRYLGWALGVAGVLVILSGTCGI